MLTLEIYSSSAQISVRRKEEQAEKRSCRIAQTMTHQNWMTTKNLVVAGSQSKDKKLSRSEFIARKI